MYLQNANPDAVPAQGTVIGEALRVSNTAFNSKERKFKAIVLISDGEDHDPEAVKMTQALSQNGVMVNTVGVGSPEGVPLFNKAKNELLKDARGNSIISKLNEAELQQLAQQTNGIYVRLDDTGDAVNRIKAQLDTIEQKAMGDEAFINYKSYFQLFLGLAFILLIIELIISEKRKWKPA
jgi:Ca-activated chloride channel family protein